MVYDIKETIVIDKDYTNTANIMHDIQTGLEVNKPVDLTTKAAHETDYKAYCDIMEQIEIKQDKSK